MRTHLTKRTVGAGVAVIALLGIGGGIAVAESADTGTTEGTATAQNEQGQGDQQGEHAGKDGKHGKHGKHGKKALLRRVEHGQFTLGGKKGEKNLLVQRGTVESMDGKTLRLKSEDGFVAGYAVNDESTARKDGQKVELSEIKAGDKVGLVATKSGDTATVKVVRETPERK